MRAGLKALVVVVVAGLLAGCATPATRTAGPQSAARSVAVSTPQAVPAQSATVTAAASSTATWTPAQAGQRYLAIVAPVNKDLAGFNTLNGTSPVSAFTALADRTQADLAVLAHQLQVGLWPAPVVAKERALERAVVAMRVMFQHVAAATTYAGISAAVSATAIDNTSDAAGLMRFALGLPSN